MAGAAATSRGGLDERFLSYTTPFVMLTCRGLHAVLPPAEASALGAALRRGALHARRIPAAPDAHPHPSAPRHMGAGGVAALARRAFARPGRLRRHVGDFASPLARAGRRKARRVNNVDIAKRTPVTRRASFYIVRRAVKRRPQRFRPDLYCASSSRRAVMRRRRPSPSSASAT